MSTGDPGLPKMAAGAGRRDLERGGRWRCSETTTHTGPSLTNKSKSSQSARGRPGSKGVGREVLSLFSLTEA